MTETLLVLTGGEYAFSFLFEGFELLKLRIDKRNVPKLAGAIFKGRVKKLAKGMGGVFVNIGLSKEAYLPIKGGELPRVGDWVMVQMAREPVGEKGAKLSDHIKLMGRYMIYIPQCSDVKCSSKVDRDKKEKLKEFLLPYIREGGVILRTVSAQASEEELLQDLKELIKRWEDIKKVYEEKKAPGLLMEGSKEYINIITNSWHEIGNIIVDDLQVWNEISAYLESFYPPLLRGLMYAKDSVTYVKRYDIHTHIGRLLGKYVWLKGGGYLVIEETEALTVIDVNSGEPCGDSQEENALITNLEAAKEIAKQIVLRDLGGIIVVDFIDMRKQENRDLVLKTFQEALGSEACNVQVYGFTKLGLLELARRRSSRSVSEQLLEPCPCCKGTGRIKGKELIAFELEKDLSLKLGRKVEVITHPHLVKFAKAHLKRLNLEHVEVKASEDVEVGKYEIHYEA